LVIIDEEQRFGVLQKERFKELRVAIDVLSLSATPIPRTLHMLLAGIRDLSVIQTPPEERQPIKTYVTAREDSLVREVITRELARGGQTFYLHNRVASIEAEAERLRKLVPEADVEVAHGQLPEATLARVMRAFSDLQDLGAGFKLAMRDLEIRGAGNLLGEEQHGEIAAVGLEMYNHMLAQAVTALRGKVVAESPAQVTVSLPIAAFLPNEYVSDERLRLRCYQEMAACVNETELDQRARGLVDRFGPMPAATDALVYSLRVRLLAAAADALGVETERGRGVVVRLRLDHGLDLRSVAAQFRSSVTATPSQL